MDYTVFIYAGIIVLAVILTVLGLVSCFKKCPSDKLLVVFGWIPGKKKNKGTITDESGAKRAAKVYPGGGVFVVPGLQSYKTMNMLPYKIISHIKGPDKGMVVTHVDVALTTAISTDPIVQVNAANRFLTASPEAIEEQIKIILDGTIRDIVATMPIEDLNNNRNAFTTEISETLKPKLNNIGFAILDINIQNIQDEDQYLVNLGKKKVTEAKANALADIADKERVGQVRIAQIEQEKAVKIAEADRDKETQVREAQKTKAVKIAEINRDQGIETATATKDQETGIAAQAAEQKANVARSEADGEIGEAKAYADAKAQVAKANADAVAAENEALADQEIRIAQAAQKQEAETAKATQEAEARKAEYKSNKEQRQAVAEQNAGVARENAKVKVAEAAGEAGIAEAKRDKDIKSAQVDANMTVARIQQERDCEVNEAKAKATQAKLNAEKIVPAQMEKETILINADAAKRQIIIQAEAEAEAVRKKAEAKAAAIRLEKEAEAAGVEALGKAEGARERAIKMADADAKTKVGMIPAEVVKAMIDAGMTPDAVVQFMTIDHIEGIAAEQAKAFEHIHLGTVNVYGPENTAANFMTSVANAAMPMIQVMEPVKQAVMGFLNKDKKPELPKTEQK